MTFDPSALEAATKPSATAERRARNEALVFHGSQYITVNPFFTIPSWWRRFLFTLLKPREIQLYCYICSQTDQNGIAFPTYENIKADLNLSNRTMIAKALAELENKGLILRKRLSPLESSRHVRNVFQRPSVEYTLYTLLTKGYIDGDFRCLIPKPTAAATRGDKASRNSKGIRIALYTILGQNYYTRYYRASTVHDRHAVLTERLNEVVKRQQESFAENKRSKPLPERAADLEPIALDEMFDEEIPF
jgi:SOS-response transcriptional repressor LexA